MSSYQRVGAARIRAPHPHLRLPLDTYSNGIDWIAVERAAQGELHPNQLTREETREAALLMDQAGFTDQQIATRLHIHERQVQRWKNAQTRPPRTVRTCTEPGCDRRHKRRGYCEMHIQRVMRAERRQQKERVAA